MGIELVLSSFTALSFTRTKVTNLFVTSVVCCCKYRVFSRDSLALSHYTWTESSLRFPYGYYALRKLLALDGLQISCISF